MLTILYVNSILSEYRLLQVLLLECDIVPKCHDLTTFQFYFTVIGYWLLHDMEAKVFELEAQERVVFVRYEYKAP